jgi:cytochrome c556
MSEDDEMKRQALLIVVCFLFSSTTWSAEDTRQMVKLPEMMQGHMLANMRNHLETINLVLLQMSKGELDKAADTAEQRLGMSSLDKHGAEHLAKFMPEGMKKAGTTMHHAASRFALKAQEGDVLPAYAALQEVTAACVACHAGYRIR